MLFSFYQLDPRVNKIHGDSDSSLPFFWSGIGPWSYSSGPTDYHSYPVFVCSNYSTAALDPRLFTLLCTRAASAMHPMAKAVQPV